MHIKLHYLSLNDLNDSQLGSAEFIINNVELSLILSLLLMRLRFYRLKGQFIFSAGTDLQHELQLLKGAMIAEFGTLGRQVIYDPDEFEAFCRRAGATSIFTNMFSSVCNDRQSTARHQRNRKAVVAILYKLVYTLSQRCNLMQKENTLFMITNNLNKDAINTERSLASTCSSRTGNRMLQESEERNSKLVNDAISDAAENGWLIIASIDNYTSVHTHRRPTSETSSSARNMATIVVSIFKDIPAISWNTASDIHIPDVPHPSIKDAITGFGSMHKLKNSYASVMPRWLTQSFFDALATRRRLNAHEYYQSTNVQQLRSFDNLYLLEFKELALKGINGFRKAIDWLLETNLNEYLQKYCILLPGDHPAQFFSRQVIYESSFEQTTI